MRLNWSPALTPRTIWGSDEHAPTILFNALSLAPGGGHSVLVNYWRCFRELRPAWRLLLLRGAYRQDVDEDIPGACYIHLGDEVRGIVRRSLWERRQLGRLCDQLNVDLYFGPNGVYIGGVDRPQCLLIQDPGPYLLPAKNRMDALRSFLLRRAWKAALKHGDCIGYTSGFMRRLVTRGGLVERRHFIAYNGVSEKMLEAARREPLPRAAREPIILAVSVFGFYKNFETLIRSLAILRRDARFGQFRLRIIGRNLGSDAYIARLRGEISSLGLGDAVELAIDRPWSEIEHAYRTASLFSLTSHCESFGIPALEAMAHGTPAVLGDCCAIPEVAGDAALLVPPDDQNALAAAWARLLSDESEYRLRQDAGRARCAKFTWKQTVQTWINVMEDLMRSEARPIRSR